MTAFEPAAHRPVVPDPTIVCVDCGGVAHLLTRWDADRPARPGDLAVYRCSDCGDRWDTLVPDDASGDPPVSS